MNQLDDIWGYLDKNKTLDKTADITRGTLSNENRPRGVCVPCAFFFENAMIHESPGTAECCKDCDAYAGRGGDGNS